MSKKYNNKSKYFKNWTTKKLKEEAVAYNHMIYTVECYGTRDMVALDGICIELNKRGIEINADTEITFSK